MVVQISYRRHFFPRYRLPVRVDESVCEMRCQNRVEWHPRLTLGKLSCAPKPLLAPAAATHGGPGICLVVATPTGRRRTLEDAGRAPGRDVDLLLGEEGLLFAFSLLELAVVAVRVGHVLAEGDPDESDEDEVGDRDGADGRVGEGRGGCVRFHRVLAFMRRNGRKQDWESHARAKR